MCSLILIYTVLEKATALSSYAASVSAVNQGRQIATPDVSLNYQSFHPINIVIFHSVTKTITNVMMPFGGIDWVQAITRDYDSSCEYINMASCQSPEFYNSCLSPPDHNEYLCYGSEDMCTNPSPEQICSVYPNDLDRSPTNTSFNDHDENSVEFPMHRWPEMDNSSYHQPMKVYTTSLPSFGDIFAHHLEPPRKELHKSRRGRPPTYAKPGYVFHDSDGLDSDEDRLSTGSQPNSRCRKGAKNILLWKFLLEELSKPGATHVQWVTKRDGVFKFIDTAECSRLWGLKKKKEDMNFEKLSRGIRHYYKDGLMSRVDGTRLVYQFHWSRVPRAYRC